MSGEFEAGGALATAALAAHELDKRGKRRRKHAPTRTECANCNAKLTGDFCQACGQSTHVHRSLWHMFEEIAHGVLHFDSKSWRTLPLLFARPGLLTKRYIDGQRVRYVSPLALFLFSTFLMYFTLSMVGSSDSKPSTDEADRNQARVELQSALEKAKQRVAERTAELQTNLSAGDRAKVEEALQEERLNQRVAEAALAAVNKIVDGTVVNAADGADMKNESAADEKKHGLKSSGLSIDVGNAKIDSALSKAQRNPELLAYQMKNTAYKFSFMLIPISLPFLWLMFFWRRGVKMYDHAIFLLYSLSFMSLLIVSLVLLKRAPIVDQVAGLLVFYVPVHTFMQLRGTYQLGVFSALWRTFALFMAAGTAFVLFGVMVMAIALS